MGVVTVLHADERTPAVTALERAVDVVSHYAGPSYGMAQLQHDLVQLAEVDMVEAVLPSVEFFTEAGKIQLLRGCLFVAIADGTIDAVPYGAAAEFGMALCLTPEHVRSVMQRFLDEHMPVVDLTG